MPMIIIDVHEHKQNRRTRVLTFQSYYFVRWWWIDFLFAWKSSRANLYIKINTIDCEKKKEN